MPVGYCVLLSERIIEHLLMSLDQALHFLRRVRNDQSLLTRIIDNQDKLTADGFVTIGGKLGYSFDTVELNQAYRHEWTMRWMHYRSRKNNR